MEVIHFGSEAEFVRIELPESYVEKGWAQVSVEISVNCFRGTIKPFFDAADIEVFTIKLRNLYESLSGEAILAPLDNQLVLKCIGKIGGHVQIEGVAWSRATYENKLMFEINLDQSYLQEPLKKLERIQARRSQNNA